MARIRGNSQRLTQQRSNLYTAEYTRTAIDYACTVRVRAYQYVGISIFFAKTQKMYFVLHVGENVPGTNNYAVSLELHIRFPFFYFLRALLVDAVSLNGTSNLDNNWSNLANNEYWKGRTPMVLSLIHI